MEELIIRRATDGDIPRIGELLVEVHALHHAIRPDLFRDGTRKYDDAELRDILADDSRPVFVAVRAVRVEGYAFCIHRQFVGDRNMTDVRTLYIDDLCVGRDSRGGGIGRALYEYVLAYAREAGCYNVTLNVWEGNDGARAFYEKVGMRVQKTGMETIL